MFLFIVLVVGCVAGSNWQAAPENAFQYESFQCKGHDYLRFSFSNHDTPVVHDPDCKKCGTKNLQEPVPLEILP
jgi:hypothetical protein